jgi:hypothetical protein
VWSGAALAKDEAEPSQVPLRSTLAETVGFSKGGRAALWGGRKTWYDGLKRQSQLTLHSEATFVFL